MSDPDAAAADVIQAVHSHVAALGRVERILDHEAVHQPGYGLSAALWLQRIDPIARVSGLAATSARVLATVRLYGPVNSEPRDAIDPEMSAAAWGLVRALSGDFRLGGAGEIDLLGAYGITLFAQASYLDWPAGGTSRIYDITVPVLIHDAWTQEA